MNYTNGLYSKEKGLHYGSPTHYLPQLGHLVFGIGRGVCFFGIYTFVAPIIKINFNKNNTTPKRAPHYLHSILFLKRTTPFIDVVLDYSS